MGVEQDLKSAQAGVERSKALIKQAEAQIAQAKASGRSTSSGERLLAAAKQNLTVFESRAKTAFVEVAKKEAEKRKDEAERRRKAEEARKKKEEARKRKEAELIEQRKATEESKRLQEEKAKMVFEPSSVVDAPKPIATTGEESQLQKLEQRERDVTEQIEKTQALQRLEAGTTVFQTGAGFKPVKIDSGAGQVFKRPDGTLFVVKDGKTTELPNIRTISPESSEGQFISGQIQAQNVDRLSDLLDVQKQLAILRSEEPGTPESEFAKDKAGVTALETAQQTRGIEATPDLFPGETIIGTAEEFGVAVPAKIKLGPGESVILPKLSGTLFAEVESPSQLAGRLNQEFVPGSDFVVKEGKTTEFVRTPVDPFDIAQQEREQTGLIPGEPTPFGSLLGFDVPPQTPKKKQEEVKITKSNDPLLQIQEAGLIPTTQKIQTGVIPFDQPSLSTKPSGGKKGGSVFSQKSVPEIDVPPVDRIGLPPIPAAGAVSGARSVLPTVESFGDFLGDLGKSLGIAGTDFFDTISKGVSFTGIFGGGQTRVSQTDAQKAKSEIAKLKKRGGSIPTSLINRAFPEKAAEAKRLGFQLNSKGEFVEGFRSKGTLTGAKSKSATALQSSITARKKAAAEAKKREEERKRREALEKRKKSLQKLKKGKTVQAPKQARIIVGTKTKKKKTATKTKKPKRRFKPSRRDEIKIRNPFESFGFGDRSGFI